jgi:hypothetical protein
MTHSAVPGGTGSVVADQSLADTGPSSASSSLAPSWSAQPWSGLVGLAVVLAAGAAVAIVPGPQQALEVLGPWSTFALPVLAVVALWFGNWPLAGASRAVTGVVLTTGILAVGLVLTLLGQSVVGSPAPAYLLGTSDEVAAGHLVSFPFTVPLAALVFATTLQLTFVCRKWPFTSLGPVAAGLAALGSSWVVGAGLYLVLANWDSVPAPARAGIGLRNPGGPVDALDLIAIVLCVVIWQMVIFFLLDGYPISKITSTGGYLVVANVSTVLLGLGTWFILHTIGKLAVPEVSAVAGAVVLGTLVTGLLFEQWPARLVGTSSAANRLLLIGIAAVVAAVAGFGLHAVALAVQTWTRDPADLWVAVTALNFLGATVIVHAAVWRRWPVPAAPGV